LHFTGSTEQLTKLSQYCNKCCLTGSQCIPVQLMTSVTGIRMPVPYSMDSVSSSQQQSDIYSVSQTPPPQQRAVSDIFSQTVENFKSIFLHSYYTLDYKFFIQLSPTLTKLCHIQRDYLVHIICSKCPATAKTHAFRHLRKSLIPLLIIVCGQSSQICCFY